MNFCVALDIYRGPLDLLLYLVRKHEVDVTDIPIAEVADQYLAYIAVLEKIDVNAVGEFLELASTLIEIKSRLLLPRADEVDEPLDDPRQELVQRLLEYKRYKDAASILEEQSRQWQQRAARIANDLPPRRMELSDQPIQEVELWDLVSALGRLMRENEAVRPSSIIYDETPIQTYMREIHSRLVRDRRLAFSEMFQQGMHKSAMIGIFLAVLELARHHQVRAEQNELHGEIWVLPSEGFSDHLQLERVDGYEHGPREDQIAASE